MTSTPLSAEDASKAMHAAHRVVTGGEDLEEAFDRLEDRDTVNDLVEANLANDPDADPDAGHDPAELAEAIDAVLASEHGLSESDADVLAEIVATLNEVVAAQDTLDKMGVTIAGAEPVEMIEPEVADLDDIISDDAGLTLAPVLDALAEAGIKRTVREAVKAKFIIMFHSGQRIVRVGTDDDGTVTLHTDTDVQYPVPG